MLARRCTAHEQSFAMLMRADMTNAGTGGADAIRGQPSCGYAVPTDVLLLHERWTGHIALKIERDVRSGRGSGHGNRIEIDCGAGRGDFTLAAAHDHPGTTFIGVDLNLHQHKISEAKRRERGLANVHFVHAELMDYLVRYVPSASISGFHVYFPTPHMASVARTNPLAKNLRGWLVTPAFMEELRRAALPGATLRFATDHRPYATAVIQLIEAMGLPLLPWTEPLTSGPVDLLVGTGCERDMRALGRDVLFLQCALS